MKQLDSLLAEIHHNCGCVSTETNDPKGTLANFKTFNELMMQEIGDGAQGKDKRLAISWNELGNAYMLITTLGFTSFSSTHYDLSGLLAVRHIPTTLV